MNVTIIGAGNMGKGIGYRIAAGGHSITLVDSNPEAAENLREELHSVMRKSATISTANLEEVIPGEVVILALWYGVNLEVAKLLADRLEDRIVVDVANPVNATWDGLTTPPDSSSAEELAKVVPASAKVVKAFNTTFAGTLVNGNVGGIPLDVFIAGDDEAARQVVAGLVSDGGLVPVETGPLQRARILEGLGFLGISLQGMHHLNFSTGWKLIRP